MKTYTLIFALLLAPLALAQTANVQKQISTDRITDDLAFGSGKTLFVEAGATLNVASGATVIGLMASTDSLDAIAPLVPASGKMFYYDSAATATLFDTTTFGRSWLGETSAATARTTLGAQGTLTNSAGLLAALSDETGTGVAVFNTSPTLITPVLGVATGTSLAVDTEVYDATGWNGDLTVPTKDAVRDKFESLTGTGDVVGPASSTDEALARFDSTTGKLLQNGAVTLSDSGAFTFPEISAPSTPAAAKVALYAKSDGLLYSKDDAGTETLVSGGAVGGSGTGLFVGRSAKTGAYTVVAGDKGYLIDCTSGTFSVSLTAAATLTDGFHVAIYNSGSGTITIDPNGSETIRDPVGTATTKTLAQGDGVVLVCNGTGFYVASYAAGWSASSTGITTADAVTLTAGTASSSTTTGTLVVTGGIGASGSIFAAGFSTAGNVTANQLIGNASGLTINASGSNQNVVLQASGTGVVRVSSISQLDVQNSTASTTTSTGGAVFAGGVGIAGQVTAGGAFKTTSTTASTSPTTGSGIFGGGVGVAGALNVGGAATVGDGSSSTNGLLVLNGATGNNFGALLRFARGGSLKWQFGNSSGIIGGASDELVIYDQVGGAAAATFTTGGSIRLDAYGAGTLTTDASGNITATSDERLKDITGNFTRGLAELRGIQPVQYKWRASTGRDTVETYSGFSAQNVLANVPEAVDMNLDGSLSLQDRTLLAAAINAINELAAQNRLLAQLVKDVANGSGDKARAQAVLDALSTTDAADKAARAAAKTAYLEQRVATRKAADAQRAGVK